MESKQKKHTIKRLPISAKKAWHMGLIDKVLDKEHKIFTAQIKHLANAYIADKPLFHKALQDKAEMRCIDESTKALALYHQFELVQMYANFYGNNVYHQARKNFVYKISDKKTPDNIALHRQKDNLSIQPVLEEV